MLFNEDFNGSSIHSLESLDSCIVYGPITVAADGVGKKIFAWTNLQLATLSRRSLRYCFKEGFVKLNGEYLVKGHDVESRRLALHDEVQIVLPRLHFVMCSDEYETLSILYENEYVALSVKPSGHDMRSGMVFDLAYRYKLWEGKHFSTACFAYDIEPSLSAIVILCKDDDVKKTIVSSMLGREASLSLQFSAVVCGELTSPFQLISEPQPHRQLPILELQGEVMSVSHCRSRDWLSLISVQPVFDHLANASIAGAVRSVRGLLRKHGYPVVGHDHVVARDHGIFLCWYRITTTAALTMLSNDGSSSEEVVTILPAEIDIQLPLPGKFSKLMDKEERFYQMAQAKEQAKQTTATATSVDGQERALFCNLSIITSSAVMTPRPSTETVVHAALDYARRLQRPQRLQVLDLGTGSGCILLSILHQLKQEGSITAFGIGVDLSHEALDIAQQNAVNLDILTADESVQFVQGDFSSQSCWQSLLALYSSGIDIIVCNPPYSAVKEKDRLSLSMQSSEPAMALYADDKDPFKCYRDIAHVLRLCLENDCLKELFHDQSVIMLEVGIRQAETVGRIFQEACGVYLQFIESRYDHKNIERVLIFQFRVDSISEFVGT